MSTAELLKEALNVPPGEREAMIVELVASLDAAPDRNQQLINGIRREEIALRRQAVQAGEVAPIPWDEAMASILDDTP